MEDIFAQIETGFWTNVGAQFFSFILGIMYDEPDGSTDSEISGDKPDAKTPGLSGQGEEMIKHAGKNAKEPEDIPRALEGFKMEVTTGEDTRAKTYEYSE